MLEALSNTPQHTFQILFCCRFDIAFLYPQNEVNMLNKKITGVCLDLDIVQRLDEKRNSKQRFTSVYINKVLRDHFGLNEVKK